MMKSGSYAHKLSNILYKSTILIFMVFYLYVVVGYFFIFGTYDPAISKINVGLAAAIFGLIVCAAVFHFGGSLADFHEERGRPNLLLVVGTFLITVFVSGYGVLTAFMMLFEGPVILRENLVTVRAALLHIEATAADRLRVPEFEDVQARVGRWQQTLMSEIANKTQCGVGDKAKEALAEIQKDLPSVKALAGTSIRNCAPGHLNEVKADYAGLIEGALKQHPLYQKSRSGERANLLRLMRDVVAQDKQAIDAALIRLGSITNFILKLDVFYDTLSVLARAQSDYALMYQRLAGLVDQTGMRDIPPQIEITPVEQLPSLVQMSSTFLERFRRTWPYGIVALLADVAVAWIVAHAILIHRRRDEARGTLHTASDLTIPGITYIWSPVRTKPTSRDP